MFVQLVVLDKKQDDVWWEMPDDLAERLMSASTTKDYADIARVIQDAVKNADEQASRNS